MQYSLGVGLLQQGAPELVPLGRLGEHQLVVEGGDAVVDDNINPVAIAPKLDGAERVRLRLTVELRLKPNKPQQKSNLEPPPASLRGPRVRGILCSPLPLLEQF